jgi:nucleotide-binding universal stress UspA family protein
MLNLLVTIDHSLEASFALRTACLFGTDLNIQPIHVFDRPGRDIALGAGWARKSWERETSRQAEETIEDLVLAERSQCPYIHDPLVVTGDPIQEPADRFWSGQFDLLVIGAPFRGMGPLALYRRFGHVARKAGRSLPLMVVRHLKAIEKIVALTDGSERAENALVLLLKLNTFISGRITLVSITDRESTSPSAEALNLERGLAILNEKGIRTEGHCAADLSTERLTRMLKEADLLVNWVHSKDVQPDLVDVHEEEIQSVLSYLEGD